MTKPSKDTDNQKQTEPQKNKFRNLMREECKSDIQDRECKHDWIIVTGIEGKQTLQCDICGQFNGKLYQTYCPQHPEPKKCKCAEWNKKHGCNPNRSGWRFCDICEPQFKEPQQKGAGSVPNIPNKDKQELALTNSSQHQQPEPSDKTQGKQEEKKCNHKDVCDDGCRYFCPNCKKQIQPQDPHQQEVDRSEGGWEERFDNFAKDCLVAFIPDGFGDEDNLYLSSSIELDELKQFIADTVAQSRKDTLEEIKEEYNQRYQKLCRNHRVKRKTPRTIFHDIFDQLLKK